MKILGINESPRGSKSQTQIVVKAVLDGAKASGAEIELVGVCKLNIEDGLALMFAYMNPMIIL